jgi:hypothetical protein
MKIWKRLRGGLVTCAIALTLTVAVCQTAARAATLPLGSVSSGSGSLPIVGLLFPDPSNSYLFTLTDHAKVSGNFTATPVIPGFSPGAVSIDVTQFPSCYPSCSQVNLANTIATTDYFAFGPSGLSLVPGSPGLFSLADLGPGNYSLMFSGMDGLSYQGSLTFAAVAATPIPAALPLFASALTGLGFLGWRRKKAAAL